MHLYEPFVFRPAGVNVLQLVLVKQVSGIVKILGSGRALFTQAQHLMQMPLTRDTSAGSMEPIGHSSAHRPQPPHFAMSVLGFTFRMLMGFPWRSRGV